MFSLKVTDSQLPNKSRSLVQSQAQIKNKVSIEKKYMSEQEILPIKSGSQQDIRKNLVFEYLT